MSAGKATRFVGVGDWFARGRIPDEKRSRPGTTSALRQLQAADIAFANVEIPLTRRGIRAEKQNTLRADPTMVEDLVASGVDIVSLANNHMLDYGLDGLADTLSTLGEVGISQVGAGSNLEAARAAVVLEGPGGTMGFVAFASTLPQGYAASADRPGIAPIHATMALVVDNPFALEQPGTAPPIVTFPLKIDVDATADTIRSLKGRADYVVVLAHWGVSGQDAIMDYQLEVGRALIDAGADMILGGHAHRLHGVEFYRGKPILYSVGHFVFEPLPPSGNSPYLSFRSRNTVANVLKSFRRECVMVDARVREGHLEQLALLPVLLDDDGHPELSPKEAGHFASLLATLSEGMGVEFRAERGEVLVNPVLTGTS